MAAPTASLASNLAAAEAHVARFGRDGVPNQIGGEARAALDGATFETISPIDLKPLARVARGKAADIDLAARAARAAFPAWAGGKVKNYLAFSTTPDWPP